MVDLSSSLCQRLPGRVSGMSEVFPPGAPGIALQTAMRQAGDGQPRMMSHKLLSRKDERNQERSEKSVFTIF